MPSFVESNICKSHQNCIPCRRDPKFRENFEKQFGKWECPLSIPIDAKDEQFPAGAIEHHRQVLKQIEDQKRKTEAAQVALEELSMVLTGENLVRLELIRTTFIPQTKTAIKCSNSGKQIGEVDQVCCGGTIKKVPAYECQKHTLCTDRKCMGCTDFSTKR